MCLLFFIAKRFITKTCFNEIHLFSVQQLITKKCKQWKTFLFIATKNRFRSELEYIYGITSLKDEVLLKAFYYLFWSYLREKATTK